MKKCAIEAFLAMFQCFSTEGMLMPQLPQQPQHIQLSCGHHSYQLPQPGELGSQTFNLVTELQTRFTSAASPEIRDMVSQLITENTRMGILIGDYTKHNSGFIACMNKSLLAVYLDIITEVIHCDRGMHAILAYSMDDQKFGTPRENVWFFPVEFQIKLNDLVCEKSKLVGERHKKFEQDIVDDIKHLKTQISMMQYFMAPCSMAAIESRIDKFIPTGRSWIKHSLDCWSLTLDAYTYRVTASSVYNGTDNFAPQNLFNGQSETPAPNYNTWITVTGAKSGWLLLQITPAKYFDCIYMQTRLPSYTQGPKDFNILGMDSATSSGDVIANFGNVRWIANEEKVFPLSAKKPYKFYKFQFSSSESGDFISIAQLNFAIFKN